MTGSDPSPQPAPVGATWAEGRSPAGQSCYEEQDGGDVQFVPEVAEVQDRHLRQPALIGVIEEL